MKSNNELALVGTGVPVAQKLDRISKEARYYSNACAELGGARHSFEVAAERLRKAESAYTNAAIELNKAIENEHSQVV